MKIKSLSLQQLIKIWKSLFFLLISLGIINNVFPKEIEKERLVEYGEKAFQQKCQASFGHSFQKMNLEKVHFIEENNQLLLTILNYQDQGFIILSADDAMMPVLAYSIENGLNMDNMAPATRYWLDFYKLQVQEVRKNKIEPTVEVVQAWKSLNSPSTDKGTVVVAPLISAQWNQSKYYNQYSPFDQNSPGGYDGRVPVGCVAVAMSMIMYYYRYPETGVGSKTNYTNYGDFYVNFGTTEYHYEAMLDDLTTYNSEVAKLIFHAATSVDMNYAADGSGAYSMNVPDALATHFNYSQNARQVLRSHSSNADWISMLKTELNNRRPVYYSGSSEEGGHAFVCDGYDSDDLFHFNFGWGGIGNGYFSVNNTASDAVGGYNNYQGIVKGIYPGGNYPNYCSEHEIITATSGSLEDGSGNQNYLNNTNCTYVIAPENAHSFAITIQTINTEENVDTLSFWKGNPENGLLVSSYSGTSNFPQTLTIENTDSLYITFKTNNTVTGEGWKLKYSVERDVSACSSLLVFTQSSGTFEDGSGDDHYASSSECEWVIYVNKASGINISFSYFDISPEDAIYIYNMRTYPPSLIATYTGSEIPPVVACPSNRVKVLFATDNFIQKTGFVAHWNADLIDAIDNQPEITCTVYPNPASDYIHIQLNGSLTSNYHLAVYDATGKQVFNQDIILDSNKYLINTAHLAEGFYTLQLSNQDGCITKKMIINR